LRALASARRKSRSWVALPNSVSQKPFFVASLVASARRRSMSFWMRTFTFSKGSAAKCDAKALNVDLAGLEAKEDELEAEIELLKSTLIQLKKDLEEVTKIRAKENAENLLTIKQGNEGVEAVSQALTILQVFYKRAGKATVLTQASPIDEDTSGPGFSGNYKGNQSGSQAVLSLLETISSDFDRTIRTTEKEEASAHREFVEFSQSAKASIASKEMKKDLDEQDLVSTKTKIETKFEALRTAQDLLDNALMELEKLKPTCMDTGMSYSERVKKREEEMKALGKALCILDADKVEDECKD